MRWRTSIHTYLLVILLTIGSVPCITHAQSCDGPSTKHTILNNLLWEGLGCDEDTTRIWQASKRWGSNDVFRRYTTTPISDEPEVTLGYLKNYTIGHRVLILMTHGTRFGPAGNPRLDIYQTPQARDLAFTAYEQNGFYGHIETADDPPQIILNRSGIVAHFRSGHFAPGTILHGHYCESAGAWLDGSWSGGEITSFTGYETCPDYLAACTRIEKIQSRMGCYSWPSHGSGVEDAAGDLSPLFWYGDGENSYDCERGCLQLLWEILWAQVKSFYVEDGEIIWEISREEGTEAYRILGTDTFRGEIREIVSEEIPSKGFTPAEYRIPIPSGVNYPRLKARVWILD